MDPFHFACPHCSSRLRVREKLYVGRQVDCPECGQSLLIIEQSGELAVRAVERKAAPPGSGPPQVQTGKLLEKPAGKQIPSGQPSPPAGSSTTLGQSLQPPSASAATSVASPAKDERPPAAGSRRRTTIVAG